MEPPEEMPGPPVKTDEGPMDRKKLRFDGAASIESHTLMEVDNYVSELNRSCPRICSLVD
jgi:hypothetical protein